LEGGKMNKKEIGGQSPVRPGEYPLGSLVSRAAARSLFKNKPKTLIHVIVVGGSKEVQKPLSPVKRVKGSDVVIEYSYEDTDNKNVTVES
jgi:hypothetical protein